jgi:CRP-like cAMP-binding protein
VRGRARGANLALSRRSPVHGRSRSVALYDRPLLPNSEDVASVIDRLREQLQQRLDQLVSEADRLRKALAAIDPRSSAGPARKPSARKAPARTVAQATAPKRQAPPATRSQARRTRQPTARSTRRTAPGATKASVLAALASGEAMTAGQVADKTGLARGTVSTTLSKLAKSGEVQKAERGYRLFPTAKPSEADSPAQAQRAE